MRLTELIVTLASTAGAADTTAPPAPPPSTIVRARVDGKRSDEQSGQRDHGGPPSATPNYECHAAGTFAQMAAKTALGSRYGRSV
jgi:hypothetical protein